MSGPPVSRSDPNGAWIWNKTLSGSHLQIGIAFQRWGSLPRPSASGPVWNRSAPFGAPDSRHAIPTTLAHPTRPGTAPDPHRSLPVDNKCYLPGGYGVPMARLGCGHGERAWAVLLAAADTSSEGLKTPLFSCASWFWRVGKAGGQAPDPRRGRRMARL